MKKRKKEKKKKGKMEKRKKGKKGQREKGRKGTEKQKEKGNGKGKSKPKSKRQKNEERFLLKKRNVPFSCRAFHLWFQHQVRLPSELNQQSRCALFVMCLLPGS